MWNGQARMASCRAEQHRTASRYTDRGNFKSKDCGLNILSLGEIDIKMHDSATELSRGQSVGAGQGEGQSRAREYVRTLYR